MPHHALSYLSGALQNCKVRGAQDFEVARTARVHLLVDLIIVKLCVRLFLLIVLLKHATFFRAQPGDYPFVSLYALRWAVIGSFVGLAKVVILRHLLGMPLLNLFYRLMGARIGRDVVINSCNIFDFDLLEIGDGTLLGGDCVVIGHVGEQGMLRLRPVSMDFNYGSSFGARSPSAYETLLVDAMLGDATLYTRQDMVDASWAAVQPILDWRAHHSAEFPNYAAGSWGPAAADEMLARRGHSWRTP